MALGAGETTLIRLTTAYAMLVNGGKRITPTLIDRVQDRNGRTVLRHDRRECRACRVEAWRNQLVPLLPDDRERVADPASAYQVVSMLQGVIQRGTGRRVRAVGKPLAGKTGTTNNSMDTWFLGFSPDLAVGVFTGFDEPRPLGRRETGSSKLPRTWPLRRGPRAWRPLSTCPRSPHASKPEVLCLATTGCRSRSWIGPMSVPHISTRPSSRKFPISSQARASRRRGSCIFRSGKESTPPSRLKTSRASSQAFLPIPNRTSANITSSLGPRT
jgi:membrane peptidoglycan carboxypeptidase